MSKKFFGGIDIQDRQEVAFRDADSSNFVALRAPSTVSSDVTFDLPAADGAAGAVLSTSGAGVLSLALLVNANIDAAAAISFSKMAALDASVVPVTDGSGVITSSAVTATELGYLDGVTSAIQTQIDGKASTALSNLGAVAINTSLVSDTDATDDLGSAAIAWATGYINALSMDSNGQTTTLQGSASATASVTYSLPPADGTAGYVLSTNGLGVLSWVSNSAPASVSDTWTTAQTATKAIAHNLGTTDVHVTIYDIATGATIEVDSVVRTDANTVTVSASSAPPAGSWKVLITPLA